MSGVPAAIALKLRFMLSVGLDREDCGVLSSCRAAGGEPPPTYEFLESADCRYRGATLHSQASPPSNSTVLLSPRLSRPTCPTVGRRTSSSILSVALTLTSAGRPAPGAVHAAHTEEGHTVEGVVVPTSGSSQRRRRRSSKVGSAAWRVSTTGTGRPGCDRRCFRWGSSSSRCLTAGSAPLSADPLELHELRRLSCSKCWDMGGAPPLV
mmetsp:Transcript_78748/g.222759  ORF Transcript_78748/g.222759 Transcript_78748/m.222759 type:complete len:209 (+) Transcript_78748:1651-2277(+)